MRLLSSDHFKKQKWIVTYNCFVEFFNESGIAAHFFVAHMCRYFWYSYGYVAVSLEYRGLDVTDKFSHVMGNFFLALHRGYVNFFEHESETRKSCLSLSWICTHVVFLWHLFTNLD